MTSSRQEGCNQTSSLFRIHISQLAVISMWLAGNLYHSAWNSNYSIWMTNPTSVLPMAHTIWDPHYGSSALDTYSSGNSEQSSTITYSGVYHIYLTVGIYSTQTLYYSAIGLLMIAILLQVLVIVHGRVNDRYLKSGKPLSIPDEIDIPEPSDTFTMNTRIATPYFNPILSRLWTSSYNMPGLRLNYQLSVLLGLTSILWTGHVIHIAIPSSRSMTSTTVANSLTELTSGSWISYAAEVDSQSHIHGSLIGRGESLLTFIGSLSSTSNSLQLTDIVHHHLAIGIIAIWSGHMYRSIVSGLGNRMREITHASSSSNTGQYSSLLVASSGYELELCISLSGLGVVTSVVAQHLYSLPAYIYLASEYTTVIGIYVHHQWIGSILMLGSLTHASLFMVREYTPLSSDCIIQRVKKHKGVLTSHLSWISQWLGFHTLFTYSHNDTVNAFAVSDK